MAETFKPVSVKSNSRSLSFKIRCLVDLQLKTIADFLDFEIPNMPHGAILDVGAGESPWETWLPKNCTYFGIDVRYKNEFGMTHRNDGKVILYDEHAMPFDSNFFNGAICIETLEHAKDPEFLLKEIYRVLKPGATLLLTVPWAARRHHIPHDYHRFTKERLEILLNSCGFERLSVRDRGNDYCVVFNKFIFIAIRHLKKLSIYNFCFRIPVIFLIVGFAIIMFLVSHLSLALPPPRQPSTARILSGMRV